MTKIVDMHHERDKECGKLTEAGSFGSELGDLTLQHALRTDVVRIPRAQHTVRRPVGEFVSHLMQRSAEAQSG